jgi:hypothetical protein
MMSPRVRSALICLARKIQNSPRRHGEREEIRGIPGKQLVCDPRSLRGRHLSFFLITVVNSFFSVFSVSSW